MMVKLLCVMCGMCVPDEGGILFYHWSVEIYVQEHLKRHPAQLKRNVLFMLASLLFKIPEHCVLKRERCYC